MVACHRYGELDPFHTVEDLQAGAVVDLVPQDPDLESIGDHRDPLMTSDAWAPLRSDLEGAVGSSFGVDHDVGDEGVGAGFGEG